MVYGRTCCRHETTIRLYHRTRACTREQSRPRQVNGNTKVRGTRQLPLRFRCQEPGTRRAPWCASLEFVWLLNRQSAGKNATLKPHRHRLQFASMLLASSHYTFAMGRSANITRHTHCFALLLCRCVAVLLVCISF